MWRCFAAPRRWCSFSGSSSCCRISAAASRCPAGTPIVPALGNYLIALFKETPLLSSLAVIEMMQRAKIIGAESFRYIEPISLVGAIFLAMSLLAAAAVAWVSRRMAIGR